MRHSLAILIALAAAPARAGDWLLDAQRAAAAAQTPGGAPQERPRADWIAYEPASRLFRGLIPPEGWRPVDEDDALGSVARLLGPDDPSGALRATLSVRFIDRDAPGFVPAKEAVEKMRRGGPGREAGAVRTLRVGAGLARVFEIAKTARLPLDEGPSLPIELHEYVAVIPRGEAYFLVRLLSSRASYLDFRDDFMRFLKELKPIGER